MDCVDKKLGPPRVGGTCVGHGKGVWLVGKLGAVGLTELIGNTSLAVAGDRLAIAHISGSRLRAASASLATLGVARMRAAKLHHKVGDSAVHMQSIVKALVRQVNEVCSSNGHLLREDFGLLQNRTGQEDESVRQCVSSVNTTIYGTRPRLAQPIFWTGFLPSSI